MFRKTETLRCGAGSNWYGHDTDCQREALASERTKRQVRTELIVEEVANGGRFSRTAAFTEVVHVLSAVRCLWRSDNNKQMLWYTTGCHFSDSTSPADDDKRSWFIGGLLLSADLRVTPQRYRSFEICFTFFFEHWEASVSSTMRKNWQHSSL